MRDEELIAELRRKAQEYRIKADSFDKAADSIALCDQDRSARSAGLQLGAPRSPDGRQPTSRRLQQIARFLERNGPATRSEVIEGAGMPAGSVRAMLNRTYFVRDDESGKWVRLREDRNGR